MAERYSENIQALILFGPPFIIKTAAKIMIYMNKAEYNCQILRRIIGSLSL